MKIAIINVVGKEKSTGKLATNFASVYRKAGDNTVIFYGRGKKIKEDGYYKFGNYLDVIIHYFAQRITGKEGYYSKASTRRLLKKLEENKPDCVILMNIHDHYVNIPMLMGYLIKHNISVKYAMPDEFAYTGGCYYTDGCNGYKNKCENCSKFGKRAKKRYSEKESWYNGIGERITFATSGFVYDNAQKAALLKNRELIYVDPCSDEKKYYPSDAETIRKNLEIEENQVVLLNVAKYSNYRKGVKYFLEAAKLLEKNKKFVFLNVGYDGEEILPDNYKAIKYIWNQDELREFYSLADALVCTSTIDGFPNVCIEAMMCGTPIIAFDCTGMKHVADEGALSLSKEISGEGLCNEIVKCPKKNEELIKYCTTYARKRFNITTIANSLIGK